MNEIWLVEYSGGQDAFHVDEAKTSMARNLERFMKNDRANDWVVIGMADSQRAANEIANTFQKIRNARAEASQ